MKGVLGRIGQGCGLIVGDISYAEVLKDLEKSLTIVTEGNCTVMRVLLFDEHMAVEAIHLGDCKDTDGTERLGQNVQYLALCDISTQPSGCGGLETEEGDVTGLDVAFHGTTGDVGLGQVLPQGKPMKVSR